jgi:type III pantothenate kinase
MNLIIDRGNTLNKMAVFENGKQLNDTVIAEKWEEPLATLLSHYPEVDKALLSSVVTDNKALLTYLQTKHIQTQVLSEQSRLPFTNHYTTPHTLGKDRLAAVAGAYTLYPDRPVLVIDAGTAITFDFKDAQNQYWGGNISPGLTMRFNALHQLTSKLPLIEPGQPNSFMGLSTTEAIQNGVQNGLIFEVEGYIERFSEQHSQLVVILTGGNAHFFDNKLKKTIFVVSNLTLLGLNTILNTNV